MSTHATSLAWDANPNEIRRAIVREMNRLGAYRLEGEYSGGHDEGGLQTLDLYDRKDTLITPAISTDALWSAVDALLSTKYYTWALEGYVYGNVHVDLKEKRAWTEGSEEYTEYRDDPDPIELSW